MVRGPDQRRETLQGRTEQADGAVSIGLTGGLAAGKSAALVFFRELGARTIAADEVVSRLYEQPGIKATLGEHFGESVIRPDGQVDRDALGRLVAQDREALTWLEAFIHPRVGGELQAFLEAAAPGDVSVCEVPLLFQSGLADVFDLVITIEADPEIRRQRRRSRGGAAIMDDLDMLQLSSEERVRLSDLAFVNEGPLSDLRAFVVTAYQLAQARMARAAAERGGRDDGQAPTGNRSS